jgi:hypothetical protein
MANSDNIDWLRKRLDAMIQLLLESSSGGATSTSSKIERLLAMGFSQAEVAQIVGKKVNYVTATVAMKKKGAARKKKPKQRTTEKAPVSEPTVVPPEDEQ